MTYDYPGDNATTAVSLMPIYSEKKPGSERLRNLYEVTQQLMTKPKWKPWFDFKTDASCQAMGLRTSENELGGWWKSCRVILNTPMRPESPAFLPRTLKEN